MSLCTAPVVPSEPLVTPVNPPAAILAPLKEIISLSIAKNLSEPAVIPAVAIPIVVSAALNCNPPAVSKVNVDTR